LVAYLVFTPTLILAALTRVIDFYSFCAGSASGCFSRAALAMLHYDTASFLFVLRSRFLACTRFDRSEARSLQRSPGEGRPIRRRVNDFSLSLAN
jgi:hypothetical protein